jgi:hypothetical protein
MSESRRGIVCFSDLRFGRLAPEAQRRRPLERFCGSDGDADRPCSTDPAVFGRVLRGLCLVAKTRSAGRRTAAGRGRAAACPRAGRRRHTPIRVQRRHDFSVANRLPDQHGPRPVAAGRSGRADAGPGPLRQAISQRQARMRPLDRFRARDLCCAIDPSSPSAPRRRRFDRISARRPWSAGQSTGSSP